MIVHGKERNFMLTVGASAEIADLCPGGDLGRIEEVLNGSFSSTIKTTAKMVAAMSFGYEQARSFDEPGYKPDPMSEEEVLSMSYPEMKELQEIVYSAFKAAMEKTVETEPSKKEKAPA